MCIRLTVMEYMKPQSHSCHIGTYIHTHYSLKGKLVLEVVEWHQHRKSDTIYHWPPCMETFITSRQESLVENNHLVFDKNLAPSFGCCLESVLLGCGIFITFIQFSYIELAFVLNVLCLISWFFNFFFIRLNIYYGKLFIVSQDKNVYTLS